MRVLQANAAAVAVAAVVVVDATAALLQTTVLAAAAVVAVVDEVGRHMAYYWKGNDADAAAAVAELLGVVAVDVAFVHTEQPCGFLLPVPRRRAIGLIVTAAVAAGRLESMDYYFDNFVVDDVVAVVVAAAVVAVMDGEQADLDFANTAAAVVAAETDVAGEAVY